MIDLALRSNNGPVALAAISQRQQISLSYLSSCSASCAATNWWKAPAARAAGYIRTRADEITVADIIVAVDEPIDATGCGGKENCMGDDAGRCMTHDLWASLNTKMIEFLDSISLKKLVDDQIAKGIRSRRRRCARHLLAAGGQADQGDRRRTRCSRWRFANRRGADPPRHMTPFPDLPGLRRHHAGGPARRRRHDPRLREHFGNPASRSHAWGWEAEEAVEKRARPGGGAHRRRPARDRLDQRRHREQQPGAQGRGALLRQGGQAPGHGEDRAQGRAGHHARTGAPGLRGDLPRRAGDGLLDLDRFKAALRPDTILVSVMLVNNEIGVIQDIPPSARSAASAASSSTSTRRRPPARWRSTWSAAGRPDEPGAHKTYGPKGHRRAVRASQAARAARGADARRRPRARHALGHAAHAPDRRHGRGLPHRQGRDGHRARAHPHAAAAAAGGIGGSSRSSSTATWSAACRTTSTTPRSTSSRASR